ncbi:MAG: STAS domain-containing protein [Janthinobacterium lividum]
MPLEVSTQRVDPDIAVLTIRGPLTLGTNLKTLDGTIQTLLSTGARRLVFDLSASPYADSAGLGTLIHTSGLVAERGGGMRLAGVSDRIVSMLRMTRTDSLLPMDIDAAASLAALQSAHA